RLVGSEMCIRASLHSVIAGKSSRRTAAPTVNLNQCMKIAIRMITGIGTPRNHSSNERMMFSLN
ncbi:hypothetical protein, partial [Pseudomonas sp. PA-6-3C]|uniref:hypothetical protein n=1 Tax=Pseudomonas sp. PA-6-3C TaxID=2665484 RepID=UPI001F333B64